MKRLLTVHGSSIVKMLGYDCERAELDVVYHASPDKVYRFCNVIIHEFCELLVQPSIGSALRKLVINVKDHPYSICDRAVAAPIEAATKPLEVTVPAHLQKSSTKSDPPPMTDEEAFEAVTNPKKEQ